MPTGYEEKLKAENFATPRDMNLYHKLIIIADEVDNLNNWEQGFVSDLLEECPKTFSPNRTAKILEIYKKYDL